MKDYPQSAGADNNDHNKARERPKNWQEIQRSFFDLLRKHPKLQYALYAIIILTVILLYFGFPDGKNKQEDSTDDTQAQVQTQSTEPDLTLEARLTQTLQKIQGAGRVEVMISYASSGELVPAMSVDKQTQNGLSGAESQKESSEPFTVRGESGEGPLVLMEIEPQIRGVIIVAEGAGDITVRMQLLSAAQTALDIPASKVEVFSMAVSQEEIQR